MGNMTKLSSLIGKIKDKASQSKAALMAKPNKLTSFNLSLLKATTHSPFSPPHHKHLSSLLSLGQTSRATASSAIKALMNRLQTTQSSAVALKSLFFIHLILKNGGFILRDQLCVFPFNGGRNFLKLSDFREASNHLTWELSSWVRWYAMYLEALLSASKGLGFFIADERESEREKERERERVSAILDSDLVKETELLVSLLELSCDQPLGLNENELVRRIVGFVCEDCLMTMREVLVRVCEFRERLSGLSFGDSVELVCVLKRVENCKEKKLGDLGKIEFWDFVTQTKNMVGGSEKNRRVGKLMSESARFKERVVFSGDSVRFGSARYGLSEKFPIVELTEQYILI